MQQAEQGNREKQIHKHAGGTKAKARLAQERVCIYEIDILNIFYYLTF